MESDRTEDRDVQADRTTPTMKNNLRRGVEFFNNKRYEPAIVEWSKVLREDPTNKKALEYIMKARARISKAATPEENAKVAAEADNFYKAGLQYSQDEEYQMAINQWIRTLTYQPERADVLEKIKQAQDAIESGAAPTKAKPGMLRDIDSGGVARESVAPAPPAPKAAPAPKPKASAEDNQALAAEAEALYEEILGGGGGEKKSAPKAKAGGGKASAAEAPKPAGFVGQLLTFPSRHPLPFFLILAVAVGVLGTLLILGRGKSLLDEKNAGIAAMQKGEYIKAISHFRAALDKMPGDLEITFLRAECYTKLQDWDSAITDLKAVTAGEKGNQKAWELLGLCYNRKNQFEEALAALENAGKGDEVVTLTLEALTALGRPQEIVDRFPGLSTIQMPPSVLLMLGWVDFLTQDYENAMAKAEQAIKKQPDQEGYLLAVNTLEQMGKPQDAIAKSDEGINALALAPLLLYTKAHVQQRSGDFESAIKTMGSAADQSDDYLYHTELGNIWMLQYRADKQAFFKDKALNAYKEAYGKIDDGLPRLAKGRALITFGDADGARKELLDAVGRFPGKEFDQFGYSYLWIAHYLLKDWDKAVATLDKCIEQNQHAIVSHMARGMTLHAKGDKAAAKASFEKAMAAQKGKKSVAPVRYGDVTVEQIKAMLSEAGL